MRTYDKDPSAVLDYPFNWSEWLSAGEEINAVPTITIDPNVPPTLIKDSQSNTTTACTVWLSAGTLGLTYTVSCRIATNQGRVDERSIKVRITDR